MPAYVCSECKEEFFERSRMAEYSPCPHCGEDGTLSLCDEEPTVPTPATRLEDPRAKARSAAADLLADQGVSEPPIDVAAIAAALELPISYEPLGNVDGELREGRIRVNSAHHPVRQRFTIAHELGHVCLHTTHGIRGSDVERDANTFAGALLVPPALLRTAIARTQDFKELRQLFFVSDHVLSIALAQARLSNKVQST
jgi:IrrE N-terminal-like domain